MSALNIAEELNIAATDRAATSTTHPTRPFLWSIRRELWENLSIFVAPAAVAAISEIGFAVAAIRHGKEFFDLASQSGTPQYLIAAPFIFIAIGIGITMLLVAVFYSLDALYGERRDRSIFFWKSLPVSDLTTVASKMAVPVIVLPLVTLVVIIASQVVLLLIGTIAALFAGGSALHLLWTLPLSTIWLEMAYLLFTMALWYAPVYAWLLLVSAWVKRAALVWAVLPFFLLALLERISFNTRHIVEFVKYRLAGQFSLAFVVDTHRSQPILSLSALTPARYLASAGLWIGLIFAVVLFFAMVRMRRYREPL
jgi:ABC-2 type transport system permease protein